jgi:hypothetical protein
MVRHRHQQLKSVLGSCAYAVLGVQEYRLGSWLPEVNLFVFLPSFLLTLSKYPPWTTFGGQHVKRFPFPSLFVSLADSRCCCCCCCCPLWQTYQTGSCRAAGGFRHPHHPRHPAGRIFCAGGYGLFLLLTANEHLLACARNCVCSSTGNNQ